MFCFGYSSAGGSLVTLAAPGFWVPTMIPELMPAQSPRVPLNNGVPPFRKSSDTNAMWSANGPQGKRMFSQGFWMVSSSRTTSECNWGLRSLLVTVIVRVQGDLVLEW